MCKLVPQSLLVLVHLCIKNLPSTSFTKSYKLKYRIVIINILAKNCTIIEMDNCHDTSKVVSAVTFISDVQFFTVPVKVDSTKSKGTVR